MAQLLMNLSVNSKDAMPDGGRLVIETQNITLDEDYCKVHVGVIPGTYVMLTVSDTGSGMDKETLSRIFEPFFTTKQPGGGAGLGLATVYGIVKQHDGHITCDSEPNRGTTFRIYFPLPKIDLACEAPCDEAATPVGGSETILLVDDEEFICDLGTRFLDCAGYTVLTARNGEECLDIYRQEGRNISLIVLDLMMPGMGGKKCLEQLLRIDPKVKVIISSGYPSDLSTSEALKSSARGLLVKPFNGVELLRSVCEALDTPRP